jgi:hypothetical protein
VKTSQSASNFIAKAEQAAFRKVQADAREMPLTKRQVLETLEDRIDDMEAWLRKFSDGREKRPDNDIIERRRQMDLLTHIHMRFDNPELYAQKRGERPTMQDVIVELEKRARSAHWWLQTFSSGPKKHSDAAIAKKRLQLAVFVQVRDRWSEREEKSDAA